ncbi:hypothetical protein pEaSNUABM35_00044 [Erwinia phage pEa_SNUABM_35]|uniref:Uncharacterized protein n=1 Tax=Erwinia phage pEa_SNUABM_35 TaxID=2869557 RepID=A0AAE7XP03_9CAUD|nr:hypothetical protein MPK65_gp044 [Erwinia phage pEa_SNUABM_35]QZE59961.1 hypothetical protein pEaSNUABM35_00044 [Erwinia phage pEa_SNUABM_35]QZE60297.1 hypothetical protein pEaSNUABM36_00044 [Erwinia phage pEa_SNUABM_36]
MFYVGLGVGIVIGIVATVAFAWYHLRGFAVFKP